MAQKLTDEELQQEVDKAMANPAVRKVATMREGDPVLDQNQVDQLLTSPFDAGLDDTVALARGGHKWEKHEGCEMTHCPVCEGGLSVCRVCGGGEGALTTDCAGVRLSGEQLEQVHEAALDYRGGQWWFVGSPLAGGASDLLRDLAVKLEKRIEEGLSPGNSSGPARQIAYALEPYCRLVFEVLAADKAARGGK